MVSIIHCPVHERTPLSYPEIFSKLVVTSLTTFLKNGGLHFTHGIIPQEASER